MDRCKIPIICALVALLLITGCQKINDEKITDSEIKMMVVISNEYDFFGKTYLKFYNKEGQFIREDIINDAGFYTNKVIEDEMFLLGSTSLYKIKLNDFSFEKVDIPNDDNKIIFSEFHTEKNIFAYKKNTLYSEEYNSLIEDVCLYNLSKKEEFCSQNKGLIKSLYVKEGLIYAINEQNECSELIVMDTDFDVVNKIEYPEKNAAKVFGINNNVYLELNDKIYNLEKNIIYSSSDINHIFMVAMKYMNDLHLLYMGNPSNICNLDNKCFSYDAMLFEQGISSNGGIVFSANSNLVERTILEDIILFENDSFKKINTIKYPQGLNIVGIYYK